MNTKRQYQGVVKAFQLYWECYGGIPAVVRSPFFHTSILITLFLTPLWWNGPWWDRTLAIVPGLLGFSIASFTIVLGIGDEKFRQLLGVRRKQDPHSTLTKTSSGFFHFILVQVIALVFALIASSRPAVTILSMLNLQMADFHQSIQILGLVGSKIIRFTGLLLLTYTLMTAIASMLNVFRLAKIFSDYATKRHEAEKASISEKNEKNADDEYKKSLLTPTKTSIAGKRKDALGK